MELEEWEFLSNNSLRTSETAEVKSFHGHEYGQPQVSAHIALLPTKDIKEINQECDSSPRVQLVTTEIESEEEEEAVSEENSEIEITRNLEFAEEEEEEEEEDDATNQTSLKWRVRGLIGALTSLAVAAAGFTMIILLGGSKENQNRELKAQIYADDKRIKQAMQQSTKLNQALSVVTGAPANISFGGYYHGL